MRAAALALAAAAALAAAPAENLTITAASVNVGEPGTTVKIKLTRWSTDEERTPVVGALNTPTAPAVASNPAPADAGARGARGAARGRGARGRGPAAPLTPIAAFAAALARAPTVGYIWTNDVTGYSIKYAWHATGADRSERIVLASDRRLGAYSNAWKTAAQAAETDYAFTVIELHVGPGGALEGKTSLAGRIAVDGDAKTVALEDYGASPVVLQSVKR
jgi:hypothetical protein